MASRKSVSLKAEAFSEILVIRKDGEAISGYNVADPSSERLVHVKDGKRLISWHGTMRLLHSADEMDEIIRDAQARDLYLHLDKKVSKGKRFQFIVSDDKEHEALERFGPSSEFKADR